MLRVTNLGLATQHADEPQPWCLRHLALHHDGQIKPLDVIGGNSADRISSSRRIHRVGLLSTRGLWRSGKAPVGFAPTGEFFACCPRVEPDAADDFLAVIAAEIAASRAALAPYSSVIAGGYFLPNLRHYGANATKNLAVSLASKLTMENGGDGLIA